MEIASDGPKNKSNLGDATDGPPVTAVLTFNGVPEATCVEATRDGIFVFVGMRPSTDAAGQVQGSQVRIINALRGESVGAWEAPGTVCGLRLSGDDRLLAVLCGGGEVALLSCVKGPPFLRPHATLAAGGAPARAGFSLDCTAVFLVLDSGHVSVFRIPEPPPAGRFPTCSPLSAPSPCAR